MNATIFTRNLTLDDADDALTAGEYNSSDPEVSGIGYNIHRRDQSLLIEFNGTFDFVHVLLLMIDFYEIIRETGGQARGYVDTDPKNAITQHLHGERVCFYLSDEVLNKVAMDEEAYIEEVNYVTKSGQHFRIDFDSLQSTPVDGKFPFRERKLDDSYQQIEENFYLYEADDFEAQYLEDLGD